MLSAATVVFQAHKGTQGVRRNRDGRSGGAVSARKILHVLRDGSRLAHRRFLLLEPKILGPFESFLASFSIEEDTCEWAKKMSLRIRALVARLAMMAAWGSIGGKSYEPQPVQGGGTND